VQRNQGNQLPKKAFCTFLPALPAADPRKNAGTESGFFIDTLAGTLYLFCYVFVSRA
jgi:hypothetical protein